MKNLIKIYFFEEKDEPPARPKVHRRRPFRRILGVATEFQFFPRLNDVPPAEKRVNFPSKSSEKLQQRVFHIPFHKINTRKLELKFAEI